jgi:hypothetical protein
MSDLKAIRILKSLLRHKDRWHLILYVPKEFEQVGKKAKDHATQRLSSLSLLSLWKRYCAWRKTEPKIKNSDDYFHAFLGQVAFDLAMDSLNAEEKIYFHETSFFTFKFK